MEDISNSVICTVSEETLERPEEIINSASKEQARKHETAEGSEEIVKLLVSKGVDISANTKDNLKPLYNAIQKGVAKMVKLFLEHGGNVDTEDAEGKTLLHLAVEEGHPTIIELILKYGPDIYNKSNRSSLDVAVYHYGERYRMIINKLLEYGFVVNPEDVSNRRLLHAAVEKGYLKIVEDLLCYGADVNMSHESIYKEGYTLLHSAVENKQGEVAELLINNGADVNAKEETGRTPIFYAIANSNFKMVKLLLTNGANVEDGPELLNTAVVKQCTTIVEILLEYISDVNIYEKSDEMPLHLSAQQENGVISKMLLNKGANVNAKRKDGETALHIAVQLGREEVVEILLKYGANVASEARNGATPLHLSVRTPFPKEAIIKMLLNTGANVNAKQKDGETVLMTAVPYCRKEAVEVLLKNGANVNSQMKGRVTPLHLAAEYDRDGEIATILLKFGADVDSTDEYGRTPLHIASREASCLIDLLVNGSDINIKSESNETPLDCALAALSDFYENDDDPKYEYWSPYTSEDVYEMHIKTLKEHIMQMKVANLYVNEKDLLSISNDEKMSEYQKECEEEIERMKTEKISNVSFCDFLTGNTNQLAIYVRNEDIVQALLLFKTDDYKTKFPLYDYMIDNYFKKGMERKELLEQSNTIFHTLFNSFPELPYNCTEKIFSYLNNKDLRSLIANAAIENFS